MKRLLFINFLLASMAASAQDNNLLLDRKFWSANPDITAVKNAVSQGNSPSALNPMAMDAVVMAINNGASAETIKFLLEQQGNDVNKLTHDSRTYIFWAANKGNIDIVNYLLKKGANVNVQDSHDMTPIGFAAAIGQPNTEVYDALIKAGANVKQKNADGASLLLLAIGNDTNFKLTEYFIAKGLSLKDADKNGNTAFNYAARSGNIPVMKALLQKGVKYTDNALLMAAQGSRRGGNTLDVFEYLLSLNIKPTVTGAKGENVLHSIVLRPDQKEIIDFFLAKGVDVNQQDEEGNTVFINAAAGKTTEVLEQLLPEVKNINQLNKKNASALTMAVKSGSTATVNLLLQHGADVNVTDAEGNNLAYYLVQSYGTARGGVKSDDFESKAKALADKGLNLAAPQKNGNTLYHIAVVKNDITLLKKITALQADVNAKNKEGLSPLHKAALVAKNDEILKYLLSVGAKKDATTEFEETAFDLAKENESLSQNHVSIDFLK